MMRIGAEIRIPIQHVSPQLQRLIDADLTLANPEYAKRAAQGKYTGGMERAFEGHRKEWGWEGEELVLPRGYGGRLAGHMDTLGLPFEYVDEMADGEALDVEFLGTPRAYQQEAVDAALTKSQGLLVLPCGAGKTVIGMLLAATVKRTALVLVHTKDLLAQWVDSARGFLGVEASTYGDGVKEVGPVTVAMVQTLARMPAFELYMLAAKFGLLLIDEVHHVASDSYRTLLQSMPCRRRYGLTATPDREDGLTPMLNWALGRTLYRIKHHVLIDLGYLIVPKVIRLSTEFRVDLSKLGEIYAVDRAKDLERLQTKLAGRVVKLLALEALLGAEEDETTRLQLAAKFAIAQERYLDKEAKVEKLAKRIRRGYRWDGKAKPMPEWAFDALVRVLTADPDRNALIVDAVEELAGKGTVLLLLNRKAHCFEIEAELVRRDIEAVALTSDMVKKKRHATLAKFKAGEISVLVATQLADEGLDVPDLNYVVLGAPAKAQGRTIQRIGRDMRPGDGTKEAAIVDVVDPHVGVLAAQAKQRARAYREVLGDFEWAELTTVGRCGCVEGRREASGWNGQLCLSALGG